MLIYGNIFVRSANFSFGAVQINSGRDNVIDNNLFIDCKQGVSGGYHPGNSVWLQAASKSPPADFFINDLYRARYPEMAAMLVQPGINHAWRNVFYRCGPAVTGNRASLDLVENGVFGEQDPGFVNAAKRDYNIRPNAPLFVAVGFRPIPVDEIGLYQDSFRASWPVAMTPEPVPDWRPAQGQ